METYQISEMDVDRVFQCSCTSENYQELRSLLIKKSASSKILAVIFIGDFAQKITKSFMYGVEIY